MPDSLELWPRIFLHKVHKYFLKNKKKLDSRAFLSRPSAWLWLYSTLSFITWEALYWSEIGFRLLRGVHIALEKISYLFKSTFIPLVKKDREIKSSDSPLNKYYSREGWDTRLFINLVLKVF